MHPQPIGGDRFRVSRLLSMNRRRLLLATLVVAAGTTAASVLVLDRVSGHENGTSRVHPRVTINAPPSTPAWLLRLASLRARQVTRSAPTTGVITRTRRAYEVRLRGDFTWLACGPCTRRGPLPVAIRHEIFLRVDPELRRVVMTSGPPSLLR
jgi:hypothetical protein